MDINGSGVGNDGGSGEMQQRGRGRPVGSKNKPKAPIMINNVRTSKRLAGAEADPPPNMKKERRKRGKRAAADHDVKIEPPQSEDDQNRLENGFPIPAPELSNFPGFDFAYGILIGAIPLPDYLPDFPPQE